jgi:excinuclease ABC subunit C
MDADSQHRRDWLLREKLSGVSAGPGVYLMKDAGGQILYVGKAGNLKKRLSSYFGNSDQLSIKTAVLVKKIDAFETILTATEKEALILESNLIKRHRPRYNVTLKDDKRYPSLRLDLKQDYPNLDIVRKIKKDGALYFGPYASAHAVRQTLKFVHKTFKLRKCCTSRFENRSRSCLNYQIGTCLGPCCHHVERTTYDEVVKEVILFLKGRTPDLVRALKTQMATAAGDQQFEKAAVLRDKIYALERTIEKQVSVMTDFQDRDVIAATTSPSATVVTLMSIRGGFLLDSHHFHLPETMATEGEIVGAFIRQYYEKGHFIPKEILVTTCPEDKVMLEDWLKTFKKEKTTIGRPMKGEKAKLVKMALQNAEKELRDLAAAHASGSAMLHRLQKRLRLERLPNRIECFDNSNLAGAVPVSAMVVFEKGSPVKADYRRYKIRTVEHQDDYAYMAEILNRRYGKKDSVEPLPDLLMVDGGKGQLNIAVSVLRKLDLLGRIDVIGIAKKDETKGETEDKIYKVGRANPIQLGRDRELLFFMQRVRDEAHRFVITFHRRQRSKRTLQSILDTVAGVGPKRKAMLLSHFGSLEKIRAAADKDLGELPGMSEKIISAIKEALAEQP